jgi:hypothetical protein
MDLKTLQNIFAETVLHGTDFSTLPIDEKGLDVGARLSIHQRNTYQSLVDFLGLSFPKTEALLGKHPFKEIAHDFISYHPPKGPDLEAFATGFPSFLKEDDFIKAVANFENDLRIILLIDAAPSLTTEEIQALATKDPDQIFLTLQPNVLINSADYAFQDYWHTLEDSPKAPPKCPTKFLLHVSGLHSYFKPLDSSEWAFLKALQSGCSLEGALENAPLFDFSEKLSYYVAHGMFKGGPL